MTSWEMVYWLEQSWMYLVRDGEITEQMRTILGVMRWAANEQKKEALQKITKNRNSSQGLINHAERMLNLTANHQMRLELWK
jgi:hypothetical protein